MAVPYIGRVVEQDGAGGWSTVEEEAGLNWTQPLTTVRNGMGTTAMRLAMDHPIAAALMAGWLYRELVVFRGDTTGEPVWWGIPVNPSKPMGTQIATFQLAESIPWLLSRRHFGKVNRTNLLADASFESGAFAPNWVTTDVDTAVVAGDAYVGAFCADLTDAAAAPDASVQQTFAFTAGGFGNVISVAAWHQILSWVGPAHENRGLYIEWLIGGIVQQAKFVTLDARDALAINTWRRKEVPLNQSPWIPPNVACTINVRGYAIQGRVKWDQFFTGLMESTSTAPGGTDLGTYAGIIVNHAQDAAYDKNDLDILVDMPVTGVVINQAHQHAEHGNIWADGLGALVQREDGLDFGYEYGAGGSSRTIKGHDRTGGAMGKGTDRTALDLSLGGDYVNQYGWTLNGNEAANYTCALGDGDGPDREEGGYSNPLLFDGRTLEQIKPVPAGTPVSALGERASKMGRARARPGVVNLQLRPGVHWETGDKVTLPAYDVSVQPGPYRVLDTAVNTKDDVMTVGLELVTV